MKRRQPEYSKEFLDFWEQYPRKNNKHLAYAKYKELTEECNVPHEQIIQASKNYTKACQEKGTGIKYIMHGSTFLGPRDRWRDYLELDPVDDYRISTVQKVLSMFLEFWPKQPISHVLTVREIKAIFETCYTQEEIQKKAYEIRDGMNAYNEEIAIKETDYKYVMEAHNWLKRMRE
jgi:hypothetical protein